MKKIIKVVLILIIFMLVNINMVFGASGNSNVTVEFETDNKNVKIGDEFTVSFSQQCADGLVGLEGTLEYDETIFELESTEYSWNNDLGSGNTITAMANEDQYDGNVFTLKFQALAETTGSDIKLVDIFAYKGYNEGDTVKVADQSVSVSIGNSSSTIENSVNNTIGTENKVGNENTTNTVAVENNVATNTAVENKTVSNTTNVVNNTSSASTADNTISKNTSLPNTGTKKVIIASSILALAAIACALYRQVKKYKSI